MSEETGPGRESYLTGGNLLNEQDRIAREKEHHTGGDAHAADPVEDGGAAEDGGDADGRKGPVDAPDGDDDVEQPAPGASIPDQPAGSITEEQNTEGGGSVPPGSADPGHTVRRRW